MKKLLFLVFILFLLIFSKQTIGQIKFDISKIRVTEIDKLVKENSPTVFYLEMKYGDSEFLNVNNIKKLEVVTVDLRNILKDYYKKQYETLNFVKTLITNT